MTRITKVNLRGNRDIPTYFLDIETSKNNWKNIYNSKDYNKIIKFMEKYNG